MLTLLSLPALAIDLDIRVKPPGWPATEITVHDFDTAGTPPFLLRWEDGRLAMVTVTASQTTNSWLISARIEDVTKRRHQMIWQVQATLLKPEAGRPWELDLVRQHDLRILPGSEPIQTVARDWSLSVTVHPDVEVVAEP